MSIIKKQGIAMPIILGLILCLAIWIASLSWTMRNSRSRFEQFVRIKQAYFMSRSALQHFFLKIKTIQRYCPESMMALEKSNKDEFKKLSSVFIEDILPPPDNTGSAEKYFYRISSFKIDSVDYNRSKLTIQVNAQGKFSGKVSSIQRLLRISR